MQTLGDFLRKGRESQNISLSDVADYTKISKLYLDCLEKDEFTKIPAEPYVKGYISSFAAYVGVDEHEALQLYDSNQVKTDDAQATYSTIPEEISRPTPLLFPLNRKTWLAAAILIPILLAIGGYYLFFQNHIEASVDLNLQEQPIRTQPSIALKEKPDPPQKGQYKNYLQPEKPVGGGKISENKPAAINVEPPIPQIPVIPASQQPEQSANDAVLNPPIQTSTQSQTVVDFGENQMRFENNLKVQDAVAGIGIKDRVPLGIGDLFDWSLNRIYIWTRIKCKNPPSSIKHTYYFKEKKIGDITLKIRSTNWRTWSYKTLADKRYIGPWRVDITSIDGKLLKRIRFEVN